MLRKKDNSKLPPIHYASMQDSGRMAITLYDLGVEIYEMPFGVKRAPTSMIAFSSFPDKVPKLRRRCRSLCQNSRRKN